MSGKGWKPVLILVGFAVLVFLVMDFNSRMAELRRLTAEKEDVSARVTSLVETQAIAGDPGGICHLRSRSLLLGIQL